MGRIAYRALVSGMVTGVGFRYSAMREAGRLGALQGYVRNVDSRTVECVVQGEGDAVRELLGWLRHGPPSARVLDIEVSSVPVRADLAPFHITY